MIANILFEEADGALAPFRVKRRDEQLDFASRNVFFDILHLLICQQAGEAEHDVLRYAKRGGYTPQELVAGDTGMLKYQHHLVAADSRGLGQVSGLPTPVVHFPQ
jgi:hypothetical protein